MELEIGGATYGPAVVTDKVRQLVDAGTFDIKASNSIFGDPWYGVQKSLSITSRHKLIRTIVVKERETLSLPGDVKILGAHYGSADVTNKVRELYS